MRSQSPPHRTTPSPAEGDEGPATTATTTTTTTIPPPSHHSSTGQDGGQRLPTALTNEARALGSLGPADQAMLMRPFDAPLSPNDNLPRRERVTRHKMAPVDASSTFYRLQPQRGGRPCVGEGRRREKAAADRWARVGAAYSDGPFSTTPIPEKDKKKERGPARGGNAGQRGGDGGSGPEVVELDGSQGEEMQVDTPAGKQPRPNASRQLASHVLRPRWAYAHLVLHSVTTETDGGTGAPVPKAAVVPVDASTVFALLQAAFAQLLGYTGAAMVTQVDVLGCSRPAQTGADAANELFGYPDLVPPPGGIVVAREFCLPGALIRIPWDLRREFRAALATWSSNGKVFRVTWMDGWLVSGVRCTNKAQSVW